MTAVECDPDAPPTAGPDAMAEELLLHVKGRLAGLPEPTRHRLANGLAAGPAKWLEADAGDALELPPFDPAAPAGVPVTVAATGYYRDADGDEFEVTAGERLYLLRADRAVAVVLSRGDDLRFLVPVADLRMLPAEGGAK